MKDAKVDRAVRSLAGSVQTGAVVRTDGMALMRHGEQAVEQALRLARGRRFRQLNWFGIGGLR